MSEPKNFVTRWSRRKLKAAERENENKGPAVGREQAAASDGEIHKNKPTEKSTPPELDISSLPSIESITAQTDIRPFLQAGVPADLRQAALRRAWVSDPAIRDYIGLSENSWDFNAPNSMMGFGSLDSKLAKELLAQFMAESQTDSAPALPAADAAGEPGQGAQPTGISATGETMPPISASTMVDSTPKSELPPERENMSRREKNLDAAQPDNVAQPDNAADQHVAAHTRRGHGTAIPR